MRLLVACAGLLLLGGCGDDSATPDAPGLDGPRPDGGPPDAPGPQRGVVVLRHLGIVDAGVQDDGGFFDFNNDGVPDNRLASLSQLNRIIQNAIDNSPNGLRLLGRLDNYDDPIADPSLQMALLHAFDADSDPANDFTGAGAFLIDPASLDSVGNPKSVLMTGHISGGTLFAQSSGDVALQLGSVTFHLQQGRLRANVVQNGEATRLESGMLGGILPSCTAKQIQIPAPINQTLLDLLTGRGCTALPDGGLSCGSQIQPDMDLNNDGLLDTFDNDFQTITACHRGALTVTGPNCACDPQFPNADGYSVVLFLDALPARIVGTAPQMDAGSP